MPNSAIISTGDFGWVLTYRIGLLLCSIIAFVTALGMFVVVYMSIFDQNRAKRLIAKFQSGLTCLLDGVVNDSFEVADDAVDAFEKTAGTYATDVGIVLQTVVDGFMKHLGPCVGDFANCKAKDFEFWK